MVDAAGEKILILLDPKHIRKALTAPELDAYEFLHNKVMRQLMGSPQAAVNYYRTPGHDMDEVVVRQIRTQLTGTDLVSMNKKLHEIIERQMSSFLPASSKGDWVDLPDFYAFFEEQATLAITESFLGSAMVANYPKLAQDLWTFMDATDVLLLGLPRCFTAAAHNARDRLLEHIKSWTRKMDASGDRSAVHTSWNPSTGCKLMQQREEMFATLPGHNDDARAAQTLALLYAGTSLSIPVTFWFLYEILRDQTLHGKVLNEMQAHSSKEQSPTDITQLATSPFLQSLHSETTRFYNRNLVATEVVAPIFHLDDRYVVERGTKVLIPNINTARFTPEWARSRPQAVTRPLVEFWPERFLIPDAKGARYSDAGLSGVYTSFGAGQHYCPGRFFARDIGLVMLVVFLEKYEVEVVDPEGARKYDPVWNEVAFGTMKPTGKVAARIRRRVA